MGYSLALGAILLGGEQEMTSLSFSHLQGSDDCCINGTIVSGERQVLQSEWVMILCCIGIFTRAEHEEEPSDDHVSQCQILGAVGMILHGVLHHLDKTPVCPNADHACFKLVFWLGLCTLPRCAVPPLVRVPPLTAESWVIEESTDTPEGMRKEPWILDVSSSLCSFSMPSGMTVRNSKRPPRMAACKSLKDGAGT